MLYGNFEEEFEDVLYTITPEGETVEYKENNKYKVYNRIYLSLQEDEIQLTNSVFKNIYDNLIEYFHTHEIFLIEQYLQQLSPEMANEVTSILMNEEREALHNWEAKQIFVKQKNVSSRLKFLFSSSRTIGDRRRSGGNA